MNPRAIIECVPNFSEGRDAVVIEAIASAIRRTAGVTLLDVDSGADTNRTVYTFVGAPDAVLEAAIASAERAYELIDMGAHSGEHPRMGALDVCPFVPVSGAGMEDCVEISKRFGARLASSLGVPVYLYEHSATKPGRRSLANIRSGEYEGLPARLADPEWLPDYGDPVFVPRWGATVTGAREFLIAYNVNLNTRDRRLANEIALSVREGGRAARDASGSILRDADGRAVKVPGLLQAVRAIGWYIERYGCAQVSVNLLDFRTTPLHEVFETVKREAEKLGLRVTGSELVGLVPLGPMVDAGRHYLSMAGKSPGAPERELVGIARMSMGLDSVAPFDPDRKIVEYACAGPAKLAGLALSRFADEVSADSPAPGGGSAAAYSGSLGAALAAMVANLTVGKRGYESAWPGMADLSLRAQVVKKSLLDAVDEDSGAFDAVMEAMRLPASTPEQAARKDAELQAGYRRATLVPLDTARSCLEALRLCQDAARSGNRNSASDAGAGALLAHAGLHAAVLNVRINLRSIRDEAFRSDLLGQAEALVREADSLRSETLETIAASL